MSYRIRIIEFERHHSGPDHEGRSFHLFTTNFSKNIAFIGYGMLRAN